MVNTVVCENDNSTCKEYSLCRATKSPVRPVEVQAGQNIMSNSTHKLFYLLIKALW